MTLFYVYAWVYFHLGSRYMRRLGLRVKTMRTFRFLGGKLQILPNDSHSFRTKKSSFFYADELRTLMQTSICHQQLWRNFPTYHHQWQYYFVSIMWELDMYLLNRENKLLINLGKKNPKFWEGHKIWKYFPILFLITYLVVSSCKKMNFIWIDNWVQI